MNDYISRRAYIEQQCHKCDGWCNYCNCDCLNCKSENRCDFIKELAEFPTADVVEQKHGKWIRSVDELGEAWMCSECLEEFFPADGMDEFISYVHYCPNCGARMDGET